MWARSALRSSPLLLLLLLLLLLWEVRSSALIPVPFGPVPMWNMRYLPEVGCLSVLGL
jgi:hypothetical protein